MWLHRFNFGLLRKNMKGPIVTFTMKDNVIMRDSFCLIYTKLPIPGKWR